jgi:hypothetical protein
MNIVDEKGELTREFFYFLRYNQMREEVVLSDADEVIFNEFQKKIREFCALSEKNDNNAASAVLGSVMSMFGFSRHYCSLSGLPIIGKYYKIGGKIVSQAAYESYQIIQEMEKNKERESSKKTKLNKKKE